MSNNGIKVVKRYALALYEVARSADCLDEVKKDVDFIDSLMASSEIRKFCLRESISPKDQMEFAKLAIIPYLDTVIGTNFIRTVVKNGRLAILPLLNEAFVEISNKQKGITVLDAEFANDPDQSLIEKIKERFDQKIPGQIRLEVKINPELIKGFRLIWNNRLIDNSIAGRLRQLRTTIMKNQ